MENDTETHDWPRCWGYTAVKGSALKKTFISPLMRFKEHHGRGNIKNVGARRLGEILENSPQVWHSQCCGLILSHSRCGCLHWDWRRQANSQSVTVEGLIGPTLPLLPELLTTDRFWEQEVFIFSCVLISEPTSLQDIIPTPWSHRSSVIHKTMHKRHRCRKKICREIWHRWGRDKRGC